MPLRRKVGLISTAINITLPLAIWNRLIILGIDCWTDMYPDSLSNNALHVPLYTRARAPLVLFICLLRFTIVLSVLDSFSQAAPCYLRQDSQVPPLPRPVCHQLTIFCYSVVRGIDGIDIEPDGILYCRKLLITGDLTE